MVMKVHFLLLDYTRRAGGPKDLIQFWTPETAFMTPETFKIWIRNLTFSENEHFLIILWTPETAFMTPETFKIRIQNRSVARSENVFSHLISAENSENV